jgi:multiple sugar transport system ATP-binding protein
MKLTLDVRPVDVLITDKASSTPVPVAIYENFGDERRVSIKVGADHLNLTTAAEVFYRRGDIIHLEFNSEKTHLFNAETGAAINRKMSSGGPGGKAGRFRGYQKPVEGGGGGP